MNTIEDLREWAGVPDDSQDAILRSIEAGVVVILQSLTNRLFISPPARATEILNGPDSHTGGLSQMDPGPQQWVTLQEDPISFLTGTFTVSSGSKSVAGVGSLALSELSTASAVSFDGQDPVLISSISDDLNFTLVEDYESSVSAVSAQSPVIKLETREEGSRTWTQADLRYFEVERRRIYSLDGDFTPGRRTVRATYRRGFEEGAAPADVSLLVLQMVKSVYSTKGRRASSVAVPGAFRVTWGSFGDEADAFMKKASALKRPMRFGG